MWVSMFICVVQAAPWNFDSYDNSQAFSFHDPQASDWDQFTQLSSSDLEAGQALRLHPEFASSLILSLNPITFILRVFQSILEQHSKARTQKQPLADLISSLPVSHSSLFPEGSHKNWNSSSLVGVHRDQNTFSPKANNKILKISLFLPLFWVGHKEN